MSRVESQGQRGLSDQQRAFMVDGVLGEFNRYQQDSSVRLTTSAEIAQTFRVSQAHVVKILASNNSYREIMDMRAKALMSQRGRESGARAAETGYGIFALTEEQRRESNRRAGRIAKEKGSGIHAMSKEERQMAGHKGGSLSAQNKTGVHGRTAEEMKQHGIKGGDITRQRGIGLFGMSHESHVRAGISASEATRQGKEFRYNEVAYDSAQEAATAMLLEKYIPNFVITPGVTYQFSEGLGVKVDFKLDDTFIEYNPVVIARTQKYFDTIEQFENFLMDYKTQLLIYRLKKEKHMTK